MLVGIVKDLRSAHTENKIWLVNLKVELRGAGEMVDVTVEGPLNYVCAKLNAIPFKQMPLTHHLENRSCLVYFESGLYHMHMLM